MYALYNICIYPELICGKKIYLAMNAHTHIYMILLLSSILLSSHLISLACTNNYVLRGFFFHSECIHENSCDCSSSNKKKRYKRGEREGEEEKTFCLKAISDMTVNCTCIAIRQ